MVNHVLMVAYHFPPIQGSSGVQRTLKFCQYLPDYGWEPIVITTNSRAYPNISDDQLAEVPENVPVRRVCAFDAARHFSLAGRYPRILALPDRWASWLVAGIWTGLLMIRKYRPKVIWSTYPIATAHLIGLNLHRLTGIPWVADFRDSMTEPNFPADETQRRVYQKIERKTIGKSALAVFTTPGTSDMYARRYPYIDSARFAVIENGFDESNFVMAEQLAEKNIAGDKGSPLTLVHSGLLYPSERDPRCFFAAIAKLKDGGELSRDDTTIILRATGHDNYYRKMISDFGISDLVRLGDVLTYNEALAEMIAADGLLLFQASNCNHQIPAKLYEYLRARRPILALTDPKGDSAGVLRRAGIDTIVRLDSTEEIYLGLKSFLERLRAGIAPVASKETIAKYTRRARSAQLAELLSRAAT